VDPSCFACHADDYHATASAAVDHAAAGFPTACETCHNTVSFGGDGAAFDHAAASGGFQLVGAHAALPCSACHAAGDLAPLFEASGQDDCYGCHQADYEGTATSAGVDHAAAGFSRACQECHSAQTWEGASFDHEAATGFALLGAHRDAACETCHSGPGFTVPADPGGPGDCLACHADDHEAAHPGFPTDCQECHTTEAFLPASFDHGAVSDGFDLLGAHAALPCEACHTGPDFEPVWTPAGDDDCLTCHTEDHAEAHPSFPTTCLDCHTAESFADGTFDHSAATDFDLLGAHVTLDCAACHTLPDFGLIGTPSSQDDCAACHAEDHQAAHSNFPTTCLDCHTTDSFAGATFDHGDATGFPLFGVHQTLDCALCHSTPDFTPLFDPNGPDDCFTCHADDHEQAHAAFPTTCLDCHQPDTWDGATFDHADATGFPLVGAHVSLDCAACHTLPDFGLINTPSGPDDCYACHEDDYEQAHSNFPLTCLDCHTTDSFADPTFDHNTATGFQLLGAHVTLDCAACHTIPDFGLIYTPSGQDDCFACHEDDHQGAHSNFPTTCLDCHTVNTFQGATFDHGDATGFPLFGIHEALDCAACHSLPDFTPLYSPSGPTDCYACHEDDHQAAHPPFPTTCLDCHRANTWDGATFDHQQATGFPLFGVHQALDCSACHSLPDFTPLFDPSGPDDCFECHEDDHTEAHPSSPPPASTATAPTRGQGPLSTTARPPASSSSGLT
jgi:hypothetical protein